MASSISSPSSPALTKRVMLFIDGQNLSIRYSAMKNAGRKPKKIIVEIDESFVWGPISIEYPGLVRGGRTGWEILRAYYYTYFTGSDEVIDRYTKQIKKTLICDRCSLNLSPFIFKKTKSDRAVKGDDIALTVEALHHAYNRNVDVVHIFTGDGDFVPLIDEIKHLGITVFVSAFSSGLNEKLEACPDMFFSLDNAFFE